MSGRYTKPIGCKDSRSSGSRIKALSQVGSVAREQITTNLTTILASIAAVALVTASAGLGALYAWQTGSEHGAILGGLTVLFALGLEVSKPLAVAGALDSLRSWSFGRAALLTILAIVAIAYSLTAELSLMAGARGDRIAQRQEQASDARSVHGKKQRIETELASIGTTRPAGAIDSELAAILTDKRLADCETWLESVRLRTTCIEKVAPLKSELATAKRREALEAELAGLDTSKPNAEVKPDPAAHALATYLAALGFKVETATLSEWLALVPVLALELGSAFAGILVSASRSNSTSTKRSETREPNGDQLTAVAGSEGRSTGVSSEGAKLTPANDHSERLLRLLRDRGGEVLGGQRAFASALNVSPATVNRLLQALSDAGQVSVEAGKHGTRVRLLGAGPLQVPVMAAVAIN